MSKKKNTADDTSSSDIESKKVDKPDPTPVDDGLVPAQMHDDDSPQSDKEDKLEAEAPEEIDSAEEDVFEVEGSDIRNKKGNYVFTIGNVSSGKSTLQNLLVARLWNKEDIALEYNDKEGDHRHSAILDDWVQKIKDGVLPARTLEARTQEFSISFSQTDKRKVDVSFIEISGENIRTIIPSNKKNGQPKLGDDIDKYLRVKKEHINKRFIFVSDSAINRRNRRKSTTEAKDMESEDVLFNYFLRYLLGKNGLNMKKIDVLFVIAKWDIVSDEYVSTKEYFQMNFPQTKSILNGDRCSTVYMPFSVGAIDDVEDKKTGKKTTKILNLESKYIDRIINWIYYTYTDDTLKGFPKIVPTFLDKLVKVLRIS